MSQPSVPGVESLSLASRSARWSPAAPLALHSEVFSDARDGGGAAMALAMVRDVLSTEDDGRSVLWVQDRDAMRLTGLPYRHGLAPAFAHRLIHVAAPRPEDALFALEEGLRCRDLACVIGEITGNPKALGFTASRRLTLAAETYGTPLFLIRLDAQRDLSSARMRWQVRSAASPPRRWNAEAPGTPAWHAELFRSRSHAPGEWILRDDGRVLSAAFATAPTATPDGSAPAPDHGGVAPPAGGGSLAAF